MKVFILFKFSEPDSACKWFYIDSVIGIYSTEDKAKEALSLCPNTGEYDYDSFDLDDLPEYPKGTKAFICSIKNNELQYLKQFSILENTRSIHLFPSVTKNRNECTVYCWATDEKHAEQISLDHFKNCHET